jgi:hypothetical protein
MLSKTTEKLSMRDGYCPIPMSCYNIGQCASESRTCINAPALPRPKPQKRTVGSISVPALPWVKEKKK